MATQQKKLTFRDQYIRDYKRLTGITDLTGQDVYGALILMTRRGTLELHGRSLWSKSQWEYLYRKMLDTADPYNDIIDVFKNAVEQTRADRHRKYPSFKKSSPDNIQDPEYRAPEEDMDTVSDELLRQDDVFY